MTPHPRLSPYIVRQDGEVLLTLPVLEEGGATSVLRIPLSVNARLRMARVLAEAACDAFCEPSVRQTDDIDGLSHEPLVQVLDI